MKPDNKIETERLSKAMKNEPIREFEIQGNKRPPICLLALSGGMNSATLLTYAQNIYSDRLIAFNFLYGMSRGKYEVDCASKLCTKYFIELVRLDFSHVEQRVSSEFLISGLNLPEGRFNELAAKSSIFPARNMVFVSILAEIAKMKGASEVMFGIHAGNHDVSPEFFFAMRKAIWEGTGKKVRFTAPLLYMTKTEILKYGLEHGTPFELTRTCYKDQAISCGKCGACTERLEAFEALKIKDPINYEN